MVDGHLVLSELCLTEQALHLLVVEEDFQSGSGCPHLFSSSLDALGIACEAIEHSVNPLSFFLFFGCPFDAFYDSFKVVSFRDNVFPTLASGGLILSIDFSGV